MRLRNPLARAAGFALKLGCHPGHYEAGTHVDVTVRP